MRLRAAGLVGLALLGAALPWLPPLQYAELRTHDLRFTLRGPRESPSKVVVVPIDHAAERAWRDVPRVFWGGKVADLVRASAAAGAKVIGLDMAFAVDSDAFLESAGAKGGFRPNLALEIAIAETGGRVILGSKDLDDVLPQMLEFPRASLRQVDEGRTTIRQVPTFDKTLDLPSLATAMSGLQPKDLEPIWINYSGHLPSSVPALNLLEGRYDRGAFRGAFVLIGETHGFIDDFHDTPAERQVPGLEIQAEALRTILDSRPLKVMSLPAQSTTSALLGVLLAHVALTWSLGRFLLCTAFLDLFLFIGSLFALARYDWMFPIAVPALVLPVMTAALVFPVRAIREEMLHHRAEVQRAITRAKLGHMISERFAAVLEQRIVGGPGQIETLDAAVLFVDIADFSKKTNTLHPEQTLFCLNAILRECIDAIETERGVVLSFVGDGLSAFFDEVANAEHATVRSARAAVALLDRIASLNSSGVLGVEEWAIRIGGAFGQVSLTLVGSETRQSMTLYGPAVNLASRLEKACKELGAGVALSDEFGAATGSLKGPFVHREVQVQGWAEAVPAWALLR